MNKIGLILVAVFITNISLSQSTEDENYLWRESGFNGAEVSELKIDIYTHELDLTVINLRGSGWNKEMIMKEMKRVAEVYRDCGIRINNPTYIESDPPEGRLDFDNIKGDYTPLMDKLPIKERPVIFFIKSDAEGKIARSLRSSKASPPYSNTVFITYRIFDPDLLQKRKTNDEKENLKNNDKRSTGNYSPTAHEIAHILCNCGHIEGTEYNLLSKYWARQCSVITESQCKIFKESNLLKKL